MTSPHWLPASSTVMASYEATRGRLSSLLGAVRCLSRSCFRDHQFVVDCQAGGRLPALASLRPFA